MFCGLVLNLLLVDFWRDGILQLHAMRIWPVVKVTFGVLCSAALQNTSGFILWSCSFHCVGRTVGLSSTLVPFSMFADCDGMCVQSLEYQLLDADLLFVNISMPMGQHGMDVLNYLTVPSISTTFMCCGYGACEFLNQASLVANFCGSQSTEVVYTCYIFSLPALFVFVL